MIRRTGIVFLVAGYFLAFGLAVTRAQVTAQDVDRAQLLRNQTRMAQDPYGEDNGVDNGLAAVSPNDPDLGEQMILKRKEHYEPFAVSVTTPFSYTSNVALVRRGERSDFIFAPAASVTYAPRITRTFYGEVTIGEQQFFYDRFSEFDFGSFDIRVGVAYYLPQLHNLILHAQYNYNRLTMRHTFENLFSDHSLFLNAELPFRFGRAQQLSLGADTSISLAANPDRPQRHEENIYLGYAVNLTRSFSVNAVGRVFFRQYEAGDRRDVSEVLALSGSYRFTKYLSGSVISTFARSRSNQSAFDYNVANVGGAVSLAWRF